MTSGATYAVLHERFFRNVPTVDFEVARDLASKKILKSCLLPHTIPDLSPSLPLTCCQQPNAIGCNLVVNFSRD